MPQTHRIEPQIAAGWTLTSLVAPSGLVGANGLRWGPDGRLYVAQAFGAQISAIDVADGTVRALDTTDDAIASPDDVAFDSAGNLFSTQFLHHRLSRREPNGRTSVIADNIPLANGITIQNDRIFVSEFKPEGRLLEFGAEGGSPRILASGLMCPNALSIGPDAHIYFPLVPLGEIWRVPITGGRSERVVGGLQQPTAVKFDHAGRLHVVCAGDGNVMTVDVVTRTVRCTARTHKGIDNLEVGKDGSIIVSHFTDGAVTQLSMDGTARTLVPGSMLGPYGLCTNSDGSLLVADGTSMATVTLDGSVSRSLLMIEDHEIPWMRGIALASDGTLFLSGSSSTLIRRRPSGITECLARDLQLPMGLACMRDGTALVAEAESGKILHVDTAGHTKVVARGLSRPTGIALTHRDEIIVSEKNRVVSIVNNSVKPLVEGMDEPHGLAVSGERLFVYDRARGAVTAHHLSTGQASVLANRLPGGHATTTTRRGTALPDQPEMPSINGALVPFAGLSILHDGSVCIACDSDGSVLRLRADSNAFSN